jgi:AsmA protein
MPGDGRPVGCTKPSPTGKVARNRKSGVKRRIALAIGGLLVVLAAALVLLPRVIDWNAYKPDITAAVREATGQHLVIDGDIEVDILPGLSWRVTELRLLGAPQGDAPDLAHIAEISGRLELFALLGRRLVIESLVIRAPNLNLVVDESGRRNWAFAASKDDASEAAPSQAPGIELPFSDIVLGDLRLEQGSFSFNDLRSEQMVVAGDLQLTVALPGLDAPMALAGAMRVNRRSMTWSGEVASLAELLVARPTRVSAEVTSDLLNAKLDAELHQQPLIGLDGSLSLETPSAGELAAWLDNPLERDPGRLSLAGRFASDGQHTKIERAILSGVDLHAELTANLDASGPVTEIDVELTGNLLDFNRYLPPRPTVQEAPSEEDLETEWSLEDLPYLASPIDVAWLRDFKGDLRVALAGIRLRELEVEPIAFSAKLDQGVLQADLSQFGAFGGALSGQGRLDVTGERPALSGDLRARRIELPPLAALLSPESPAVAGFAGGRLSLTTEGATLQDWLEAAQAKLTLAVDDLAYAEGPEAALSFAWLAFERPAPGIPATLAGALVYQGRPLAFDLAVELPGGDLARDRLAVSAALSAELAELRFVGSGQAGSDPDLEGRLNLETTSLGELASWLELPLTHDPGRIEIEAEIRAEKNLAELTSGRIGGAAGTLAVSGRLDATPETPKVELKLSGERLDLDSLLAAARPQEGAAAPTGEDTPANDGPPPSEQPFELDALSRFDADLDLQLKQVTLSGQDFGPLALSGQLRDGRLATTLERFGLAGSRLTGKATLDASGETLALTSEVTLAQIEPAEIEALTGGPDRTGGDRGADRRRPALGNAAQGTTFPVRPRQDGAGVPVELAGRSRGRARADHLSDQAGSDAFGGRPEGQPARHRQAVGADGPRRPPVARRPAGDAAFPVLDDRPAARSPRRHQGADRADGADGGHHPPPRGRGRQADERPRVRRHAQARGTQPRRLADPVRGYAGDCTSRSFGAAPSRARGT